MALARFDTDFRRWEKTPGSPVCEVDLDIDRMLKARLTALLPDAGWLSEETADNADRLGRDRLWVVDPIDGTRDYIRARPGWCVSIALVERGHVVIGVLDAPSRGERWSAALPLLELSESERASLLGALAEADEAVAGDAVKPVSVAELMATLGPDVGPGTGSGA